MSLKALTTVFETVLPHTPKHILLAIADFADESGSCFPSLRTLRYKTSLKKTTLSYHLRVLEQQKLIIRTKRYSDNSKRNTSTIYIINLKKLEDEYTFKYKNLSTNEKKELEIKINDIEKRYQRKYQDVRKYETEKKKKNSQREQLKNREKSQCEQTNKNSFVNNLNHQSYIDDEELNKNFDDFYIYLNSIGIVATKSIPMHKNTIKANLKKRHRFTIENYIDFLKTKTPSIYHDTTRQNNQVLNDTHTSSTHNFVPKFVNEIKEVEF